MMRTRFAWALAIVDVAVLIAASLVRPDHEYLVLLLFIVGIGAFGSVGALLVSRVPGNPIGMLMLATATLTVAAIAISAYAAVGASDDPSWPGTKLAATIGNAMVLYPIVIALVGIPLIYPDGRLPSRRFRWVVLLTITGMIAWMLGAVINAPVDGIVLISIFVAFGGAVIAVFLRFRRGDRIQRQQVKWLAAVVVVGAINVVAGLLLYEINPGLSSALTIVGVLALATMPFVIGLAILRYRLYEIDRIISRTLSYAVVTGILAVVFAGVVLVTQTVLSPITAGQTIPVAASTLAVFALFQPVLRRVRRAVDRRFDRARYDSERTVAAFADRLRDEMDLANLNNSIETTIREAIAPQSLGIWLRTPSRDSVGQHSP